MTKGVVVREEELGDFNEYWKVLRFPSVHGTVQKDVIRLDTGHDGQAPHTWVM